MLSTSIQVASSSCMHSWKYDVFLSFRGEDTRKTFVDHLYEALQQKGIFTFKDDLRLERGKEISPSLLKAIEESRFAIIIFSRNYASSTWCLDELLKIVECKNARGQIILPVFYDVDPSNVRKQRGSFEEALTKYEETFKEHKDKVENWRRALFEAASVSGWDSNVIANGHEAKLVREIVKYILCKLGETDSSFIEDVVGLDPRVAEVNSLLDTGSDDTRIVRICGIGGIGKTTIAKAVYDQNFSQFDGSSFIANVREASKKHGLESLQEQLLSEILLESDIKIRNVDRGLTMIKKRLRFMRVLVVLDDVDQLNQLEALVGKLEWFGSGSRIIVTTRDTHLLVVYEVNHVYKVEELNNEDAMKLFCCKAFRKNQPIHGYEMLTNTVVHYAKGVPLALKVLGSFLLGRSMIEWKSAIDRLGERPNEEIQDVLKISYDGLDYTEKEIFLDIACFFKGESRDYVAKILEACSLYPDIGISVLVDKSLVTISNNKIEMHDLIQEMGWHLVIQESPKEPGRRSRLWCHEDIYHTLVKNTGTKEAQGIIMDSYGREEIYSSAETFSKMNQLRLLKISNVQLPQGLEFLSNELSLLDWQGYPLKYLPSSFQPDKLVELKMSHSRLQQLWSGSTRQDKLRYIDLSYSLCMTKTPDFTGMANLEELILEGCMNLLEVHPSIGTIRRLISLNLKDCKYLKVLPTSHQLKSLQNLVLSGCSKLQNVSEVLVHMRCLTELYLDGTGIKELPIEHLSNLVLISLRDCKFLTSLPSGICGLKLLKTFILSGCSNLNKLPENLGEMQSLEELRADLTAIKQPPSSIVLLENLKVLSFRGCKGTTSKPWNSFFSSLLMPRKSQDSIGLVLPPLSGLCSLKELDLSDCNLSEGLLPSDLGSLSSLEQLKLSGNEFASFSATISGLSKLISLELVDCKKLKTMPELPSSIVYVSANGCTSLERLPNLSTTCNKLEEFTLSNCCSLAKNQPSNDDRLVLLFQSLLQKFSVSRHQSFTIVVPGREVPKCFNYQNNMGHSVCIQLSLDWYKKLKGFVICAVFATKGAIHAKGCVDCYWMSNDNVAICIGVPFIVYKKIECFDSDHMFLHYLPFQSLYVDENGGEDLVKSLTEFRAILSSSSPRTFAPIKCAAYLLYEKDLECTDQRRIIQQTDSMPEQLEKSIIVHDSSCRKRNYDDCNISEAAQEHSASYEYMEEHNEVKRLRGATSNVTP